MVQCGSIGVSLQERRSNEDIIQATRVEPIEMVMRRLEQFGHAKRRYETDGGEAP